MPTYDYHCTSCGCKKEVQHKITEPALTTCPECHLETFQRGPGGGAGLIFKGSGFYTTDYAKEEKPKPSSPCNSKPETKSSPCCPCDKH